MSVLWSGFVEVLEAGIFVLSQFFGGQLGTGILVFSFAVRLALLPLTYFIAKRMRAHGEVLKKLQPELKRIQERHASEPALMLQRTRAVFERHGVRQVEPVSLLGSLPQIPLFAGIYQAIQRVAPRGGSFLWIDQLARPDVLLALGVSGLVGLGIAAGGATDQGIKTSWAIPMVLLTGLFLLRASAAFGLYVGASGVVGIAQSRLLARARTREGEA